MGSVSTAKLHKSQTKSERLLPYEEEMRRILDILMHNVPKEAFKDYSTERPVRKVAFILVSSNKTFCGAFNSNAVKLLAESVAEYERNGLSRKDITVYGIGDKGAKGARKEGFHVHGDFTNLADKQPYEEVEALVKKLTEQYLNGEIDRVELIYNHFKNAMVQIPTRETYLPFNISAEGNAGPKAGDRENNADGSDECLDSTLGDYIVEPKAEALLERMMPQILVLKVYSVLLDAATAEHAARTMVMRQATENGEGLLQELRLLYNKQRQQAITTELLDIVGGTTNN